MWILFALSGPVFWAISTHIDKFLVERYFKNNDVAVLMVFTALIGALMLPPIGYFEPDTLRTGIRDVGIMMASGFLYMSAMLLYLRALQSDEASIVAPLFQTSTLFTFLLAYLILGEVPGWVAIGGAILVIAGALVISLELKAGARQLKLRLTLLMLGCTFVLALSSVLFKYFAVRDDFWTATFWINSGNVLFGLGILAISNYRGQFARLIHASPGPVIAINSANELVNLGGGLGVRFASLLAPIALVSAISSTSTLFVFLFGVLLTLVSPTLGRENLSSIALFQKGIGAALVAAGVAIINWHPT